LQGSRNKFAHKNPVPRLMNVEFFEAALKGVCYVISKYLKADICSSSQTVYPATKARRNCLRLENCKFGKIQFQQERISKLSVY
jgi:hypothetical protein